MRQQKSFYAGIGALKSVDYLGGKQAGKGRIVYYRATYKEMTLYYSITLDDGGEIVNLFGEPDKTLQHRRPAGIARVFDVILSNEVKDRLRFARASEETSYIPLPILRTSG